MTLFSTMLLEEAYWSSPLMTSPPQAGGGSAVDDVVGEVGALGVGVELDGEGGGVVEEVVGDLGVDGVGGVDRVVVVAVGGAAAFVEAVAADRGSDCLAAAAVVAEDEAAASVPVVGDVVVLDYGVGGVDPQRVGAVVAGTFEVHA